MLVREGDARNQIIDIRLAAVLAATAGCVNSAGFEAVGLFSANMTGNASSLSDRLALGSDTPAIAFAMMICAFIVGSFSAGLGIESGRRKGFRWTYAGAVVFEGAFLAGCALLDAPTFGIPAGIGLGVALAMAMGFQNAITTRISNARVRTTHVSGIVTDVGLEVAALLVGDYHGEARSLLKSKLVLHGLTILAFILGGLVGVLLHRLIGGALFALVGFALIALVSLEWRSARHL